MRRKTKLSIAIATAALAGTATYAQDKYSLKSPDEIAFSDFKGYEDWSVVSSARTDEVLKVIVANPTMIEAYKAGIPGNGQVFPDGSKIAKLQRKPKKSTEAPFVVDVPDVFTQAFVIEKDTKRFPKSAGSGRTAGRCAGGPWRHEPAVETGQQALDLRSAAGRDPQAKILLDEIEHGIGREPRRIGRGLAADQPARQQFETLQAYRPRCASFPRSRTEPRAARPSSSPPCRNPADRIPRSSQGRATRPGSARHAGPARRRAAGG